MWQDVTSYSQGDKKRLPNCWSVKVGHFKLSLVWNHRYCPDTWSTSLFGVYENHDLKLSSYDDLVSAQRKALLLAEKVIGIARVGKNEISSVFKPKIIKKK